MPYTPVQDGTHAFGIPDSPITINGVVYILEDFNPTAGSTVVEIKNPNGVPTGQVIIPEVIQGTAKLQLATTATAHPTRGQTFTLQGAVFYVTEVGVTYTQGQYTFLNISFRMQINA